MLGETYDCMGNPSKVVLRVIRKLQTCSKAVLKLFYSDSSSQFPIGTRGLLGETGGCMGNPAKAVLKLF